VSIIDRFKEIGKEIEGAGTADADQIPIITAILTGAEHIADAIAEKRGGHHEPDDYAGELGPTQADRHEAWRKGEGFDEDDGLFDGEPEFDPPILSGRQPVSLLQEVCQERDFDPPRYEITREGGDDHVPKFGGTVTVDRDDDEVMSKIDRGLSSKVKAKKALALAMLTEHFGAKQHREKRS